jgi:hypothetical protein
VPKGKSYIQTTVLVDSGVYAVVRHPQYLAGILLSLALILITQHRFIAILGVVAMVLNYLIARKANQELIEKFGDDYKRYMQKVPRISRSRIPSRGGSHAAGSRAWEPALLQNRDLLRMNFLVGLMRLLRPKA